MCWILLLMMLLCISSWDDKRRAGLFLPSGCPYHRLGKKLVGEAKETLHTFFSLYSEVRCQCFALWESLRSFPALFQGCLWNKQTNQSTNPKQKPNLHPPSVPPPRHLPKAGLFLFSLCMKVVLSLIMQLNKVYLLSVRFIKYLFLSGNPEF